LFCFGTVIIELMNQIIIYIALILSGLCLGSFAGASVWRLRARQLKQDKAAGEKIDEEEYKHLNKLTKHKFKNDRSQCLNCSYYLKWYDLIPVLSWVMLLGKCRKCHKPIGWTELLVEIGLATFFALSYFFWPFSIDSGLEILRFVLWLMSGVVLAILFIYDKKWALLPNIANFSLIGLGLLSSLISILVASDKVGATYNILGAALILSGLYYLLYIISKGKWIGFGDIKLGLGLALLLADWKLAFVALFSANMVGCLLVLPPMIVGKLKRDSHIPFGPLLIIGLAIAMLFGKQIIDLYMYNII